MKKIIYGAALASALLIAAGASLADADAMLSKPGQNASGMHKVHKDKRVGKALAKLDLKQEQKTKIRSIIKSSKTKLKGIYQQVRSNFKELKRYTGKNYNAGKINTIAKSQGDLVAQMIATKMDIKHQIFQVLTPDQQVKMQTMEAHHQKGFLK